MALRKNGWESRLVFVLVLGLAGTLATDSPFASSESFWMGFAGIAIGVVALVLERLVTGLRADGFVYITAGTFLGLTIGLLLMLVLHVGDIRLRAGGADLLVLVPFALAYVFSRAALTKGRKLNLLKVEEERGTRLFMPVLVDLNAIIDGRVADLTLAGILPGPFTVPASVRSSLESLQKSKNTVSRGRARRGTETLQRLEEAVGKTGGLLDFHDFGDGEREKHRMLEWLRQTGVVLLSSDAALLDTAEREGIHVIRLDDVGAAGRAVVLPGEKLTVRIQKKGRGAGQGVGFLSDGTMVVVDEAASLMGSDVTVTAHTTFRASGGTMVFASMEKQEEEALEPVDEDQA